MMRMKKLAIGCGVVLVVCVLGATVAGYFLYMKARSLVQPFQQIAEIAKLDKNVANEAPFRAPANGELTEDLVRRFVSVQESMTARLGKRVEELTAKQNEFQRRQQSEHRDATAAEAWTVLTDMMGLVLQAKNAQVDALNQSRFSLKEYYWVRGKVYAAAGMSIAELNFRDLPDAIKEGGGAANMSHQLPEADDEVPPRNKELVKPYLEKLKEWAPFAFFGL